MAKTTDLNSSHYSMLHPKMCLFVNCSMQLQCVQRIYPHICLFGVPLVSQLPHKHVFSETAVLLAEDYFALVQCF